MGHLAFWRPALFASPPRRSSPGGKVLGGRGHSCSTRARAPGCNLPPGCVEGREGSSLRPDRLELVRGRIGEGRSLEGATGYGRRRNSGDLELRRWPKFPQARDYRGIWAPLLREWSNGRSGIYRYVANDTPISLPSFAGTIPQRGRSSTCGPRRSSAHGQCSYGVLQLVVAPIGRGLSAARRSAPAQSVPRAAVMGL